MRDGFEQLDITPERLTEIGLPDFGPEISLSCANHGGSGMARLQQWDAEAKQWNLISDFTEPDQEVLEPLIAEDSEAYAKEAGITPIATEAVPGGVDRRRDRQTGDMPCSTPTRARHCWKSTISR